MKKKLYLTVAFCCVTVFFSKAVTVDAVLDSISVNNLQLQAEEAKKESRIAEIQASNNLGDTEFGFEYQKGDNIDGHKYGFTVSQGFDWFGMYGARSNANKSKIAATQHEFQSSKLNVLLNAKLLCMKIINANQLIAAQTEIYNNITQLFNEYEKGFNHGEISILDINKLKIERLNVKQVLDKSVADRKVVIEELVTLNGNHPIANLETLTTYPTQELKSYETYEAQSSDLDPENRYMTELLNSSEKEVTMAKMGWLPKFSIGYKYANELGDRFNGVELGVSLPIFSNRNKVKAAKSEYLSEFYIQQSTLVEKIGKIKADYATVVYLREQINAYSSALSDTSNKDMLKKALDGGQITLLNYLLELRYFLEAQQTLLNLEFEYNTTLSNLNKYDLL